jgi:hypothetical protein
MGKSRKSGYVNNFFLTWYFSEKISGQNKFNMLPNFSKFLALLWDEWKSEGGRLFCTKWAKVGKVDMQITFFRLGIFQQNLWVKNIQHVSKFV